MFNVVIPNYILLVQTPKHCYRYKKSNFINTLSDARFGGMPFQVSRNYSNDRFCRESPARSALWPHTVTSEYLSIYIFYWIFMTLLPMNGRTFSDENESKRDLVQDIFNYTWFGSILNFWKPIIYYVWLKIIRMRSTSDPFSLGEISSIYWWYLHKDLIENIEINFD